MFRNIVEKVLKEYKCNLNEDAKADRADYLYLHDCFNKYIEGLEDKLEPHCLYCDSDDLSVNMETNFGKVTVYLKLIPEDDMQERESTLGYYKKRYDDSSYIVLNLYKIVDLTKLGYVERFDTDPYTYNANTPFLQGQTIVELARKMQSVFFHEFTHFIDDKERKRLKKEIHPYNKNSDEKYYNQPHETNAYYMEILNDITIKLFKKYNKSLAKMTPEERLDFIKKQWPHDEDFMAYYNKLKPKAQKRLLSRLYKYFSTADLWNNNNE